MSVRFVGSEEGLIGQKKKGEMHFTPNLPTSGYSLPRAGGVAYAAQESWIQNATIRENILFGAHFDRPRYEQGPSLKAARFIGVLKRTFPLR